MMSVLVVKDLSKSYGKHKVLDNVSLVINRRACSPGRSQRQQNTFLNCIANVINIDSGQWRYWESPTPMSHLPQVLHDNTVLYSYLSGLDHLKFVCETAS